MLGHSSIETTRIYLVTTVAEYTRQMEKNALKFPSESQARRFIADDLERPESGPYFVSELSLGELLEYCPDMYEVRRAALNGGAA